MSLKKWSETKCPGPGREKKFQEGFSVLVLEVLFQTMFPELNFSFKEKFTKTKLPGPGKKLNTPNVDIQKSLFGCQKNQEGYPSRK